jgi:hypothetical protein
MYNGEIPGRKQEGKNRARVKPDSARKLYLPNTQSQHVANAAFLLQFSCLNPITHLASEGRACHLA